MEKFAVDLEKVLDEFEFNEEREERVPSSVINNQSLSYICQTAPVRPGNYRRPSFEPINLADADFAASTQSPSTRFGAVTSSKHVALPPAAAAAATIDSSSSATSKTQPTLINSNWRAPSGERAKHEEKPDLIDHSDKVKQVTADVSSRLPDVTTLSSSNNAFVDVVSSPASHKRFVDSTASYNNTYTDDSSLSSTKNSFVDGNSLSTSDNKFIDSTTLSSSNNPFDDSTKFSSTDNKFIDSTISSSTNNTLFVDVNTLSTSNNAFVDSTTLSSSNNAFVGEESAAVINPVFDLIDDNSVHPCNNINNSAVNINNFNNKVNSGFVVDKLVTDDYSSVVETDDNSLNNEVIRQKVGYCTDDSLSTNRIPSDVTDGAAKLDNNNGDEYVSDPSGVEISLVEESELVEDREEKKEEENKGGNRKEELSHIEGERQICEGEVSVECSNVSKEPVGVIEEDASNLYKNEPVEEKTHLIVESVVSNIQSVEEIEVKVSLQSVDDIDLPTGSDSSKFDKQPETVSSNFEIDEQLETGSSKCEISEHPETDSSELEAVKHPEPLVGFKPFSEPSEDDEELDKYLAELEILEKEEKELEEQQGLSEVGETVKQDSIQEDSEELSTGSGSDSDETAELHDIIEPPQQKARELVASGLISRSKESISRSLSDFIEKDISVDVKEESSREFQVAVDRQNAAFLDYYNSNSPVECAGNGGRLNSVSCASGSSTDLKPLECQVGVAVEQTKSKSLECQVGGEESGENRKEAESSGKLLECKVAVRRTKNSSTIEKEGNVDSVIEHTESERNKETDSVIGQKVESDSVSTQKLGADSVTTQKLDSAIGQKQESDSVITESESSSLDSSEYECGMGNTSEKASGSLATDNVDIVASTSSSRHPASVGDESWSSSSEDVTASKCDNGRLTSTPKCDNGKMTTTTKCDDGRLAEPRATGEMADDAADKPSRPNFLELPARITMDNSAVTSPTPSATPSIEESEDGSTVECGAGARQTAPLASEAGDEQLGRVKPVWVPDEEAPNCMQCHLKFGLIKRRHHCRACGKVLCSKCCSMKAKLLFMDGEEARVCQRCYSILERDGSTDGARSPLGRQPNPNNPMEYCSTIPPLQQVAGSLPQSPPSVLVPVGVLKREGRAKSDVTKQVMFSDGIRPGGDLTELDGSTETKLPFRRPGRMMKRVGTPPGGHSSRTMRRPMDPVTGSFIPGEGEKSLPPTVVKSHGETIYTEFENTAISPNQPPLKFAINRNLFVHVKRVLLECCVNRDCWCITSEGLACVGQDEIILVLECLPDETVPPKDVFLLINSLYEDASKGNTVSELSFSPAFSNNLLGSKDHGGFLYIRPTYQCTAQLILPNPPYLVALLIHRWETPWARLFPIRLELRLGAEFRYYPCPLVSVRHRPSLYTDIGHTIISLLADFRLYNYTLPVVRGLVVHMEDRQTTILIPRNRYDQVLRALNNSNDSVLPFGANFSLAADSHLVCMQSMEDENTYHTQAINIQNKPRKVTGASFVVFNGALKPSSVGGGAGAGGVAGGGATVSGKSSIVEDGLMVQVSADTMVALRGALRDMRDYTIGCGPHAEETVLVRWTQDDCNFNIGVKSMIDGRPLDGVPSMRVHSGIDFSGNLRIIRWTEVFILQSEERNSSGSSGGGGKGAAGAAGDPVDISRLSESLAQATCLALVPFLDLLAAASLTAVALRANIHPDNVGYEAGSNGERLPPLYMKTLDDELVAVLHDAAQAAQDAPPAVLELVFRVMES